MTSRTTLVAAWLLLMPLTVSAQEPERFDALVGLARVKRDAGDARTAARHFEAAQQLRPLDPSQLAEYFWILAGADPVRARAVAERVLHVNPAERNVRERAIALAVAAEDEVAVRRLAAAGEQISPDVSIWPRRLGESFLRGGQPDEAAAALARAVQARDADEPDWAGYAVALEGSGQMSAALDAWAHVRPAIRAGRRDWGTSRLRAMAAAAPIDEAAAAIEEWLSGQPDDDEMRGVLVEAWARAGQPTKALGAMGQLTSGPRRAHWLLREGELAQEAGDRARAIRAFEQLARTGHADTETLWTLAELMVEATLFERAGPIITKAASGPGICDERSLTLYDRFPDPHGTNDLLAAIGRRPRRCPASASWVDRAALRAVALGRATDALRMVEREVEQGAASPVTRSLLGRLLLWTGEPGRAAQVLEPLVANAPTPEVVDALIDAYRATGRPRLAWPLASSRLHDEGVSDTRRLQLASLAIEADHPDRALEAARALESREPEAARMLAGQALLALGRPAEALESLESIDGVRRDPAATLALADAVAAMEGVARALDVARGVSSRGPAWSEFDARHAQWEAIAGDRVAARSIRDRLAQIDPRRAALLDAEIALADRQPAAAVNPLRDLVVDDGDGRAADLYATALAGTGDVEAALRVLGVLRQARPSFVPFELREAEWAWRAERTPARLTRVLDLARRHATRADAQAMAARVLFEEGQYDGALDALGGNEAAWLRQPVDGHIVAARALRALGRPEEALRVVGSVPVADGEVALLRAQLTSVVHGAEAAGPLFESLAASDRNSPGVYLAWGAVQATPRSRQLVLERAVGRFPRNVELLTALAEAAAAAGDWPSAIDAADGAIALDEQRIDAWIVEVDAAVRVRPSDVDRTLDRFAEIFAHDPARVVGMAERIAGLARSDNDPLVVRATRWLDGLPEPERRSELAMLARARVLAASETWSEALAVAQAAIEAFPASLAARRLRADLLAFSGRYDEAIAAYDAYLREAPLDLEAARLSARVAGWAGDADEARERYEALVVAHPEATVIAAEATAKDAFYQARWREAVPAYEQWLALEPGSREAAFELAQSQAALGDLEAAGRRLHQLDTVVPVHRLARAASDRLERARRPSGDIYVSRRTSDGYDGLRLLDVAEQGGTFSMRLGASLPAEFGVVAGAISAGASGVERNGYRASAFGSYRFSPSWQVEGRGGVLEFDGNEGPSVEGRALVSWSPADHWRLFGGGERVAVLENMTTVDARLQATGGVAGLAFEGVTTAVQVAGARQSLSDGNGVASATVTASHALTRGTHELRLVGWGWYVGYDEPRADYFSPASFVRADIGFEWSWWLDRPRFRADRERRLAIGYLIGTDSDAVIYHHPSARLLFELPAGMAFEAGVSWIRSEVYQETNAHVGVRVGAPTRTTRTRD